MTISLKVMEGSSSSCCYCYCSSCRCCCCCSSSLSSLFLILLSFSFSFSSPFLSLFFFSLSLSPSFPRGRQWCRQVQHSWPLHQGRIRGKHPHDNWSRVYHQGSQCFLPLSHSHTAHCMAHHSGDSPSGLFFSLIFLICLSCSAGNHSRRQISGHSALGYRFPFFPLSDSLPPRS